MKPFRFDTFKHKSIQRTRSPFAASQNCFWQTQIVGMPNLKNQKSTQSSFVHSHFINVLQILALLGKIVKDFLNKVFQKVANYTFWNMTLNVRASMDFKGDVFSNLLILSAKMNIFQNISIETSNFAFQFGVSKGKERFRKKM